MTDKYSRMSPFLRAVDRATAPPDDGSAPVDHVIAAGIPGGYNTLHSAVSGLRGVAGDAGNEARSLYGGMKNLARSAMGRLGYDLHGQPVEGGQNPGEGIHDPHTGVLIPTLKAFHSKIPSYNPQTGKTTLVNDSPLPEPYSPEGGRFAKFASPDDLPRVYGGDPDGPNVTDVPKNVSPPLAAAGVRGANGGRMKGYAFGGGTPETLAERGSMYNLRHEGFLNSAVAGRTDHIGLQVRNGSYVIPADVVSAAGQGNSLAGANAFDKLLKQGPYGTRMGGIHASRPMMPQMPRMGMSMGMARPPGMGGLGGNFNTNSSMSSSLKLKSPFADGGHVKPRELVAPKEGKWSGGGLSAGGVSRPTGADHIPILAAGGEYIVMPETVARIGNGDQQKGFKILDKLVLMTRKKHIDTLKKLKPPKKK